MSYPTDEGGVGFKKLQDICNSFAAKRWWRFRVENNLWTRFLRAKYCQRSNPISKKLDPKDSNSWRSLLEARNKVDLNIQWKINKGNSLNTNVSNFLNNHGWNIELLKDTVPQEVVYEVKHINIGQNDIQDQAVKQHDIKIKHCFREGNEVADALAKHATTIMQQIIFLNENDLPSEARKAICMDRQQVPNFRIRPRKHAGWFFEPP
ncbi:hypothetical protein A4A49_63505 [Nicotiana attenuata]|uniref:RNase H type-1 domain-containing protein n=1 Tax=Nicotiana attenuata TaxID=49451 RepID=A0A1J6JXI2_NICAT|nr:hypothetical protein A4A49_63505 [Nicotiana attenuata]